MKHAPWVVLALLLGSAWVYDPFGRVKVAEGRVLELTAERNRAEARAYSDSIALESLRDSTHEAELQIEHERQASEAIVLGASRAARTAGDRLRAVLDSLGASVAPLDSLEAAHAAEVDALRNQIRLADSTTAVVRTLLAATEQALASERAAKAAFAVEGEGLRAEIRALNAKRRTDKLQKAGLAVITVLAILK